MSEVNNLHSLMRNMVIGTQGETVSVGDLLEAVGRRAYGPLLLVLGFISISPISVIPGANWLVSAVTLLIALQIAIGLKYPWVPRRLLKFEFKRGRLLQGVAWAERYAKFIDRYLKPRLTFLTGAPFVQLVALICVAAVLVSFPLGFVPLGPFLPGMTVLVFGLAISSRDGLLLILATALLGASVLLLINLWNRITQSAMMDPVFSFFFGS